MPQKLSWSLAIAAALACHPQMANAQADSARQGDAQLQSARNTTGVIVGDWNVAAPEVSNDATYAKSLTFSLYSQRGLNSHMALESSVALWRRITTLPQTAGKPITTKSYIIPLLTCLKIYPITTASRALEPYLMAGIGFALGIQQQSENAIGGGGTDVVTGFGAKAGIGVEYHVTQRLGLLAAGRVQWLNFSDRISDQETFTGNGVEAGITYRFTI